MPVTVPIVGADIKTGPGVIYVARLGSALPDMNLVSGGVFTGAWPAAWFKPGPTDNGMGRSHQLSNENVEVEESLTAVRTEITGVQDGVTFAMAALTLRNLHLALAGGTIVQKTLATGETQTANGSTKFSPPVIGGQVRFMIGHESDDNKERFVAYQVLQTGNVQPSYRKGNNKRLYAVDFRVELPDPTVATVPWNEWRAGDVTI